jgi:hypothetical protein
MVGLGTLELSESDEEKRIKTQPPESKQATLGL